MTRWQIWLCTTTCQIIHALDEGWREFKEHWVIYSLSILMLYGYLYIVFKYPGLARM